jgi:hypothetical protein
MMPSLEERALNTINGVDIEDERLASIAGYGAPKAKPESARPLFGFIPASEFLGAITAPDWTIRDILESDSLVVLFGDPESGKSFMAMDWAACVATGRPWNGFKVKQGPVLYINGEGRNGVNRRFTAWAIANQCPLTESPLFMSTMTTALTDSISRAEIEAVVAEFVRTYGEPRLVIIDTLARNFGPGDENSTQDMTVAVATCDAIRELTHATVALVHHSGHGDKNRARGSIVLKGAADAEYRMARMESGDTTMEAVKMKDAAKPQPMSFRFAEVELGVQDDEGREVTSAVLKRIEYQPAEEVGMPQRGRPAGTGKNQAKVLEILVKQHAWHVRNVVRDGRDQAQARVMVEVWRDECVKHGIPKNRFADAMAALKRDGKVRFDSGFVFLEGEQ